MKKLVMFALYIGIIGLAAGAAAVIIKILQDLCPGGNITGMSGKAENWNLGGGKKVYSHAGFVNARCGICLS